MTVEQFLIVLREAIERMDLSDSVVITPFRSGLVVRIGTGTDTDSFTVKVWHGAEFAYDDD